MGNVESLPTDFDKDGQEDINLFHFKIIKSIGEGTFGKVFTAQHIKRRELYALKVIEKTKCIKMKAVKNVIRERKILERLNHPLVCNMRFAFQDEEAIYMAMDLMAGGDLRYYIGGGHSNDEQKVKFWIAELICAVKYLHSQGIVHRDIKPDNILLDSQGHVHLSDFNIACDMPDKKVLKGMSGTAVYFAPEIFQGAGYNEDVDWWSVGITMYECIYGRRPWTYCTDIDQLCNQVLYKDIQFKNNNVSNNCISAMKGFLQKNPNKRLGHGIITGWKNIASHPFFLHSIDWYKVNSKQSQPKYPSFVTNNTSLPQQQQKQQHIVNNTLDRLPVIISDNSANATNTASITDMNYRPSRSKRSSNSIKLDPYTLKLLQKFKSFDYTIFEQYEGFLDRHLMTVGPPPNWVKPAFPGADNGTLLPVRQLYLDSSSSLMYY